jgi:hypothetical protein
MGAGAATTAAPVHCVRWTCERCGELVADGAGYVTCSYSCGSVAGVRTGAGSCTRQSVAAPDGRR